MSTQWILSEGSYSDYSVIYICPDEATARAYYERFKESDSLNKPEEVPVLATIPPRIYQGTTTVLRTPEDASYERGQIWMACLPDDGTNHPLKVTARTPFASDSTHFPYSRDWTLTITTTDTDRERALKRAADMRALISSDIDAFLLAKGLATLEELGPPKPGTSWEQRVWIEGMTEGAVL